MLVHHEKVGSLLVLLCISQIFKHKLLQPVLWNEYPSLKQQATMVFLK